MKFRSSFIALFLLGFFACSKEETAPAILPPSNLTITADVSETGSGKVIMEASAENSNYFEFEFGDGNSTTPVRDDDGKIEYTYSESGSYTITVRAHTTAEVYIEKSTEISVLVTTGGTIPDSGYTSPDSYVGYNLIWRDEFEGNELNDLIWTHEIGTGINGWGNNELQYYREENTTVYNGYLIIEAKKENFSGRNYTSSRIISQGKKSFKYGRVDIRAALPKGQGIWPALWMLGANFGSIGWPACGEIDIMELVGGAGKDNTVYGTVHWDNAGSYASYGNSYSLSSGIFADEFHVFSIIWDESNIKWYMDDVQYHVVDITPSELSEFQNEFFFIFNVAVGGDWPGNPDGTTGFPQRMVVDYIRVFQPQ